MAKNARQLLYIGKLGPIVVYDPKSKRYGSVGAQHRRGLILCWDTEARNYVFCHSPRPAKVGLGAINPGLHKAHRKFHGAKAGKVIAAEYHEPVGKLRQVALIDKIGYRVPKNVKAPTKNGYAWIHKFGDTKHSGNSDKGTRVMPALMVDAKGNLFVKRRKGNIYTVDSWLRG